MIIVTGTKRSGTSMWMQILIGAGFPPIGKAFPAKWEQSIKDANPSGFYESRLRRGINYQTNPDPESGEYLHPDAVRRHVVKVFIPGLIRSDHAFLNHVVATMRPWREYEASLRRLCDMERQQSGVSMTEALSLPPHLEWWAENFSLIRDIATRRYPVSLSSYDALLDEPEEVISRTLSWIGEGDLAGAVAAVEPGHRTQHNPASDSFDAEVAAVCDELYDTVHRRKGLGLALIERLNACDDRLEAEMREAIGARDARVAKLRASRGARAQDKGA